MPAKVVRLLDKRTNVEPDGLVMRSREKNIINIKYWGKYKLMHMIIDILLKETLLVLCYFQIFLHTLTAIS